MLSSQKNYIYIFFLITNVQQLYRNFLQSVNGNKEQKANNSAYTHRTIVYSDNLTRLSDAMTASMMLSLIMFLSLSCITNSAGAPSPLLSQWYSIMFFRYTAPITTPVEIIQQCNQQFQTIRRCNAIMSIIVIYWALCIIHNLMVTKLTKFRPWQITLELHASAKHL